MESFRRARPALIGFDGELKAARMEATQGRGKRKRVDTGQKSYEGAPEPQRRKTRSQNKEPIPTTEPSRVEAVEDTEEEEEGNADEDEYTPKDGLIACPICSKRMQEEEVFPHLDVHNEPETAPSKPSLASRPLGNTNRSRPAPRPPERLPQLSYGLLKDQALRKKLTELGIPSIGPRGLMIKRHTEWVNLVNANCDSSRPKSRRELLDELSRWERSEGRQINDSLNGVDSSSVMRKDFDGKGWATTHGDNFQQLIATARAKAKQAKRESPSEREDEPMASAGEEEKVEEQWQDGKHGGAGQEKQNRETPPVSASKDDGSIAAVQALEERSPFFKDPIEPPSASTVDLTSQG